MKMNLKNLERILNGIVWTSLVAALAGTGALVSAFLGSEIWVLAFGFVGVISATLAAREK
jgi:hypothetical protein